MSTSNEVVKPPRTTIFWARLPGFTPWPARQCSAYEEKLLKGIQPTKLNDPLAVLFLGIKRERAWIVKSNVFAFEAETWSGKFDKRKFKTDRDYRAAIAEAIRITNVRPNPDVLAEIIEISKEYGESLEFCGDCGGSVHSGSIISCAECAEKSIHWHCFRSDDPEVTRKVWVCDDCCLEKNYPLGTTYFNSAEDSDSNSDNNNNNNNNNNNSNNHSSTAMDVVVDANTTSQKKTPNKAAKGSQAKTPGAVVGNNETVMDSMAKVVLQQHQNYIAQNNNTTNTTQNNNNNTATTGTKRSISGATKPKATTTTAADSNPTPVISTVIPENRTTTTNATTTTATISTTNNINSNTKLEADEVDDNCFVCGEAGEVLLCDFPLCRKVYHQVCVLKVFPSPNTLDLAHQQLAYTNEWWCPRHFCLDCGAISAQCAVPLSSLPLPQVLYDAAASQRRHCPTNNNSTNNDTNNGNFVKNNGESSTNGSSSSSSSFGITFQPKVTATSVSSSASLTQRPLRACSSCPFTLCTTCDTHLSRQASVFLPTEFSSSSSSSSSSSTSTSATNNNSVDTFFQPITPAMQQLFNHTTTHNNNNHNHNHTDGKLSAKPVPRALSSLFTANEDAVSAAATTTIRDIHGSKSSNNGMNSSGNNNLYSGGVICKFCLLTQHMQGEQHILDTQLASVFHPLTNNNSNNNNNNNSNNNNSNNNSSSSTKTKSVTANIAALSRRIPARYKQRWQIGKLLEIAWVKMANTRLSLPFLCPLLPLDTHNNRVNNDSNTTTANADTDNGSNMDDTEDLMYLLERIHALYYEELDVFQQDVGAIRDALLCKLQVLLSPTKTTANHSSSSKSVVNDKKNSRMMDTKSAMKHPLLLAFHTIEFAGLAFIRRQESRVWAERQFVIPSAVIAAPQTNHGSTTTTNNNLSTNNSNGNDTNNIADTSNNGHTNNTTTTTTTTSAGNTTTNPVPAASRKRRSSATAATNNGSTRNNTNHHSNSGSSMNTNTNSSSNSSDDNDDVNYFQEETNTQQQQQQSVTDTPPPPPSTPPPPPLQYVLQLLPICARLACHLHPVRQPGLFSATIQHLVQLYAHRMDNKSDHHHQNNNNSNSTDNSMYNDFDPIVGSTLSSVLFHKHPYRYNNKNSYDSNYSSGNNNNSSSGGQERLVTPRSLAAWTEHVNHGDHKTRFYYDENEEAEAEAEAVEEEEEEEDDCEDARMDVEKEEISEENGSNSHRNAKHKSNVVVKSSARLLRPKDYLDMSSIVHAKHTVQSLLQCQEEDVFAATLPKHTQDFPDLQHMLEHDLDIAESMLQMKHSASAAAVSAATRDEDISLLYPHENLPSLLSYKNNANNNSSSIGNNDVTSLLDDIGSLHPHRQQLLVQHLQQQPLLPSHYSSSTNNSAMMHGYYSTNNHQHESSSIVHRMGQLTHQLCALQQRLMYTEELQRKQLFISTNAHLISPNSGNFGSTNGTTDSNNNAAAGMKMGGGGLGGQEMIRIGEVSLITELKLANDNLRWKVTQRDNLLANLTRQLTQLQRQVSEQAQTIELLMMQEKQQQEQSTATGAGLHKRK